MRITIITATFNSEKSLADCLNWVAAQTYNNIEHIIVDGGSTDKTMEIVKAAPSVTKYISEPDQGIYDAQSHKLHPEIKSKKKHKSITI